MHLFFCDAQVFNTRHQSLVHCDGAGLPFAPLDVLRQHRLKRFGDQCLRGVDKGIEGVGFRQGFVAGMEQFTAGAPAGHIVDELHIIFTTEAQGQIPYGPRRVVLCLAVHHGEAPGMAE